jgi:hypothetical protein
MNRGKDNNIKDNCFLTVIKKIVSLKSSGISILTSGGVMKKYIIL